VDVQALDGKDHGYTRRLIVEDNGIGMYPEFMARMYEPFSQEQRPEAKNVIGTGLGLSIVKNIVDLMQGRITVQSKPNRGTRFIVDLPIEHWKKEPVNLEQIRQETRHHAEEVTALLAG
jgi:two-component system sensor histidine kinase/response regulator